jgi:hypothetical protein
MRWLLWRVRTFAKPTLTTCMYKGQKSIRMQSDGQLKRNVDMRLIRNIELGKQKKKKVLVSLVSN